MFNYYYDYHRMWNHLLTRFLLLWLSLDAFSMIITIHMYVYYQLGVYYYDYHKMFITN